MKRVLIAGAGYVGGELARLLAKADYQVFALSRGKQEIDAVKSISADLLDSNLESLLPEDLDYLVYSAAAKERSEQAYRAIYVDALANLLRQLNPRVRIIFTSSTSVYPQNKAEIVNEESETNPSSFSGQLMLEAERLTLEQNGIVVRLSGIYGPGRNRFLKSAINYESAPEDAYKFTNRIHLTDCAGVLKFLIENELKQQIFLASDCKSVKKIEVVNWLREQSGLAKLETDSKQKESGKRCSSVLLQNCGYSFNYPSYKVGYAEMLNGL